MPDVLAQTIERLSPREKQAVALAAEGKTNAQIAADIGISEDTTKLYLLHACRTLGVRRRHGLPKLIGVPKVPEGRTAKLDKLQIAILDLLVEGNDDGPIGAALSVPLKDVKQAVRRIYRALQVTNRTQAVCWYLAATKKMKPLHPLLRPQEQGAPHAAE